MKYLFSYIILFFTAFGLIADEPVSTSKFYGGEIIFKNSSSYNLFLEFDIAYNPFGELPLNQFALEKLDAIVTEYYFLVPFEEDKNFDIASIYPKNYFKNIRIYDMETGILMTEIKPSEKEVFILIHGNVESFPAFYILTIEDTLLIGG